ncbi:MAG: OpgC domain-containing protein [Thalassobaculaceae bacterium]|nr:OpgC domain-containing protein [Thalassobaculaceae bacterium]
MSLPGRAARDPRLDFFRGIAMLIIFIAHVPGNLWANYIPARYGWSDATEMFVFCSGFAAALAFGSTFYKAGFAYGTMRIGYRVWQIYAAHIAMFIFIATLVFAATSMLDGTRNYVDQLNLGWFFENPGTALTGLFTLTYVPNYFDILPMYIGALVMVPAVMALARIRPVAAMAFVAAVYAGVHIFGLMLPAHPEHPELRWFFNPLAWQLLFFTGFSFAMGWLPAPRISKPWVLAALVFVVLSAPAANWEIAREFAVLRWIREVVWSLQDKTDFGLLRYLHFLALAYIAIAVVNPRIAALRADWAKPIVTVGQNSLAVFLLSMGLSRVAGIVLDQIGRSTLTVALVNIAGLTTVIGFAYWCTMLKKQPWRKLAADYDAERGVERPAQPTRAPHGHAQQIPHRTPQSDVYPAPAE